MKSTLFLHNVTHVDCAIMGKDGKPTGLSFTPVFTVSGKVDAHEQVVQDFSSLKKRIKDLIDDRETGYDHKFIHFVFEKGIPAEGRPAYTVDLLDDYGWKMTAPSNAYREIVVSEGDEPLAHIAKDMSEYLSHRLGLDVKVHVPEPEPVQPNGLPYLCGEKSAVAYQFEYTHGLPKSSSWGCQNIMHGHSSFIHLGSNRVGGTQEAQAYVDSSLASLGEIIAAYLDEAYFVCRDHVTKDDKQTTVAYSTGRGRFEFVFTNDKHKIVVLDKEPTIENLVEHIAAVFKRELAECRVTTLAISEGLWKGSLVNLAENEA